MNEWREQVRSVDARRELAVPGDRGATFHFCVEHWLSIAQEAIAARDAFYVALSGGSTPKVIYQALAHNQEKVDWSKVYLFWSDERCVPPTDPESNYRMAMESGFNEIPVPPAHIFRMKGELPPEEAADAYEALLDKQLPEQTFDLVMLGMGEDGHTASLFPNTAGLKETHRLAIANYVPQKECWRLTLTFEAINRARHTVLYILGKEKAQVLKSILGQSPLPAAQVGTKTHKALWIADDEVFLQSSLT